MTAPESTIPTHRTPAARAEKLIPAVILLVAAVCVLGVISLVVAAWPPAFGEPQWRGKASATFLTTVPQLTFLLTMIAVAGVYSGQHRAVRAAACALFLLALLLVAILPFFALDFLTVRRVQPQDSIAAFTREGLRIGATSGALIPFLVWAAIQGWAAGKPDPTGDRGVSGQGLVVGQ